MDLTLINFGAVFIFVILVVLGFARILTRYFEYKKAGMEVPALLPRDLFLFGGLAVPFIGLLVMRASGIVAAEAWWYPIWVIGSNTLAISGTAYWVYIEYFRIGKPEDKNK